MIFSKQLHMLSRDLFLSKGKAQSLVCSYHASPVIVTPSQKKPPSVVKLARIQSLSVKIVHIVILLWRQIKDTKWRMTCNNVPIQKQTLSMLSHLWTSFSSSRKMFNFLFHFSHFHAENNSNFLIMLTYFVVLWNHLRSTTF